MGAYASFALTTRVKARSRLSIRDSITVFLASSCITLGSWACQRKYLRVPYYVVIKLIPTTVLVMSSRYSLSPSNSAIWLLNFNSGFVVLSVLVPLGMTYAALLLTATRATRTNRIAPVESRVRVQYVTSSSASSCCILISTLTRCWRATQMDVHTNGCVSYFFRVEL